MIGLADVIDTARLSGSIKFGATIRLVDEDTDEEKTYQIVGEYEADIENGRLNIKSPLARALIGKEAGDSVEVRTRAAKRRTRSCRSAITDGGDGGPLTDSAATPVWAFRPRPRAGESSHRPPTCSHWGQPDLAGGGRAVLPAAARGRGRDTDLRHDADRHLHAGGVDLGRGRGRPVGPDHARGNRRLQAAIDGMRATYLATAMPARWGWAARRLPRWNAS